MYVCVCICFLLKIDQHKLKPKQQLIFGDVTNRFFFRGGGFVHTHTHTHIHTHTCAHIYIHIYYERAHDDGGGDGSANCSHGGGSGDAGDSGGDGGGGSGDAGDSGGGGDGDGGGGGNGDVECYIAPKAQQHTAPTRSSSAPTTLVRNSLTGQLYFLSTITV